jgi:hypothetical protein
LSFGAIDLVLLVLVLVLYFFLTFSFSFQEKLLSGRIFAESREKFSYLGNRTLSLNKNMSNNLPGKLHLSEGRGFLVFWGFFLSFLVWC